MDKKNLYLTLITCGLAIVSAAVLALVGIENLLVFIVLLILLVDLCCFPCAYMYQVDCKLQGKFSLLEGVPAPPALLIVYILAPYFAILYIFNRH